MNPLIRFPAVIAAGLLFSASSFADDAPVSDVTLLRTFPILKSEEMKQVLFQASIPSGWNPAGVHYEIHNPFRDRTIAALVVTVAFKKADAEKPTVLELLLRTECGPLQSAKGGQDCFDYENARNPGTVITLKEVYYVEEKPTPAP